MLVKELIEALKKCDADSVVVSRSFEDGSVVKSVSDKHPSQLYWKGGCPVKETTPAICLEGVN